MAVLMDIGEEDDIHPHNKQDVGKRLALLALDKQYGFNYVSSGPKYKSHQPKGRYLYVDFDSGKGWFSKDGTVQTVNGTPNVSNGTNPHFTFTANKTLTEGAGGVHYGTQGKVTIQNHESEWSTTPTGYTPFSTLAEGEA